MNKASPWTDIETPGQDYNVRKIPETKGVPLYWGKDRSGQCLFIIELSGDQTDLFKRESVRVRGIKSDLRFVDENNSQRLVISLERHIDQDLFAAMCQTLTVALREVIDSAIALSVALTQIKRWKAFMAGKKKGVLSFEEVRGLFGELIFLEQLMERTDKEDALNSWEGPDSVQQDFIFGNTAVEVKALSGRERNSIRVSSEDQLDSLNDRLFLKVFRLSEMPESEKAVSLNELVRRIADVFSGHTASELFHDKIATVGYVELLEYDNPKLVVSEEQLYRVDDNFPKLIRSSLPDGVSRVRYDIALEKIRKFLVENNAIWEK